MLPYALPLTLGILGAVAVAVILVEVVPKVLEDRERSRRERERRRRGRVAVGAAVPVRTETREARASALEGEGAQGEWKFKVRQRKGRREISERGGTGGEDDHLLSPTKSHHVLGSDVDFTDQDGDENVPLAQLSARSRTPSSGLNTATRLTPVPTGTNNRSDGAGTAPLFSPALSLDSASTGLAGDSTSPFEPLSPSPEASPFLDAPSTLLPPLADSRSPTLVGPSSSESSPAAPTSLSAFSSPLPLPFDDGGDKNPFADAARPHAVKSAQAQGGAQILFDLPTEEHDNGDGLSDGWVRSPTLNSDAGSGCGSEEGGWTKLSDHEGLSDDGGEGEGEWAKVKPAPGGVGLGLGVQSAAGGR
ncbi:hypothetical protein JCM6882_006515 [Rhodosporidiobolus microsporus]